MSMPPRFPVSADDIDRVIARFYAAVRAHPDLGPVFAAHITDWPPHEAKIASFWRNAILLERSYAGNPMRVHMKAGNVHADHFPIWLALFDDILTAELPAPAAQAWSALAHRIGQGLRFGLTNYADGPPVLNAG